MSKTITIIFLFFSTLIHGQVQHDNPYKNIEGLEIVNAITWEKIKDGFVLSDGNGGNRFLMDSNMTFRKIDFDCVSKFAVDSGAWAIKNLNTLVLKSKQETLYFEVIRFGNFYFFIMPAQKQKFLEDFQVSVNRFKKSKSFPVNNETDYKDRIIAYQLFNKYYSKESEPLDHDSNSNHNLYDL